MPVTSRFGGDGARMGPKKQKGSMIRDQIKSFQNAVLEAKRDTQNDKKWGQMEAAFQVTNRGPCEGFFIAKKKIFNFWRIRPSDLCQASFLSTLGETRNSK